MSGLLTKFLNVSHKTGIRVHFTTYTIILAMTVLLLLPALDNGFPFWYPDASQYVGGFGITHVDPSRSIYYILFTRVLDLPIPEEPFYMVINTVFGKVVYDHYRNSKQIRNELLARFDLLNYIQPAVLVASALVLIGFLVREPKRSRKHSQRTRYAASETRSH